jgi:fermentation-respiration switch protein FrsA (DUF1100 family)
MPGWFYTHFALIGVRRVERQRKNRFFHLEPRMRRIRQPLLMIHGEADTYIKMEMARALFRRASGPKELWAVPGARHNQSIAWLGKSTPGASSRFRRSLEMTMERRECSSVASR